MSNINYVFLDYMDTVKTLASVPSRASSNR